MTSPKYGSPFEPSGHATPPSSLRLPKIRGPADSQSITSSVSTLPYRASNASVSSLFAATSTPTGSRSVSPSGAGTPSRMQSSVFGGTPGDGQAIAAADRPDDPRNLIIQAFVPHIAVHSSSDTQQLVKDKGFDGGLWELLRPFGERVQGKVNVRDSIGAGKTYEDFAVRFVQLGDGREIPEVTGPRKSGEGRPTLEKNGTKPLLLGPAAAQRSRTGGDIAPIESLVDRHLTHAEDFPSMTGEDYLTFKDAQLRSPDTPSPFHTLYLRRLLSGIPVAPHETFSHPVACVIAISSRNANPIETLRKLYDESSHGEKRLPLWVSNEYLRYYVLVHDEEQDDITKSMTLFEQMKRHFGLHCHLLRLRSSQCVATDDDSIRLPRCEWMAAPEEIAEIQEREAEEDYEETTPCIFESDTTAIKTFIREMVTQSIIPSMERCIATWNDQVASRRRGFSGRLTNMTKKWSVFGGVTRTSLSGVGGGTSGNYDGLQGFYRPDTPEAIMRKLADYAFMLRDWKLAQSTYELLRSDFNNDNAWKYHAAANEMSAISTLLVPQSISSKTRIETIDKYLEAAQYSYVTRCGATYGAVRCLALAMELLRLRGGGSSEDAAKWGLKLLELKAVGVVGDALVRERISAAYASKRGAGSELWGSRTRKSAMWSVRAADAWLTLGKPQQSKQRLDEAMAKYSSLTHKDSINQFPFANEFLKSIQRETTLALYPESGIEGPPGGFDVGSLIDTIEVDEEEDREAFVSRPHRRSLMGPTTPMAGLASAPLHGTFDDVVETGKEDQFE